MPFTALVLLYATLLGVVQVASTFRADPPKSCSPCDEWNGHVEPFRIFGNTYYVGVAGLSAILITSEDGHILLDGGLPQSAPRIDTNIRALGYRLEDVRLIGASHEHFDHVGGIAALQRASGAVVAHSAAGVKALARGEPNADDPQYAFGYDERSFPRVENVRAVADGETLRVGLLAITAHLTPGHTPGGTTWSWRSCEGPRCLDLVYADSLNAVSHDSFRFTTDASRLAAFRASIAKVAALPCDIVIAVHPGFTDLAGKLERRTARPETDPFVDPDGCRSYAADAAERLDERVAREGQ